MSIQIMKQSLNLIYTHCLQIMQQIQLSPVKLSKEEIREQKQDLNNKINLLISTVAIDEITVLFFNPEGELDIQPEVQFCNIIKKPVPPIKPIQIETIERITFCFYSMLVEAKLENLPSIQVCYQSYIQGTTYASMFVNFHERVRKWCKQLALHKNFTKSKQNLQTIFSELKENNSKRLQILIWKVNVCLILFEIIADKVKIQRNLIIKLLKSFKSLKKQNKISTKPVLDAFKFMIRHFISLNNDLYVFFERQIKIWYQEIVDNSLISQMKDIILQCEQMSASSLKSTANAIIQEKAAVQRKLVQPKPGRKIVMNTLNSHLFYESNPTLITGRRLIRRRPSQEKEDNFQKKIDHFLKTRSNNIQIASQTTTPRGSSHNHLKVSIKMSEKPSISIHSLSRFTLDQAFINKNLLKSSTDEKRSEATIKETSRVSFSASKSVSSFYRKGGTRKRKQMYQKIIENQGHNRKMITNKYLKDEMFQLCEIEEQRCKITLEEILIGQFKKQQADPNVKFIGVSQDNQFGDLNLTFFTIFNQELAQIFFTLRKVSKQGYILNCYTKSTYCNHPTIFKIEKKKNSYEEFTFDDLNENIVNSVIYYEALQEKIERKISVAQLQAMQELLRQSLGIQLSQSQLTKLLVTVDLFESYFFWYYTKCSYINGCRLEKRAANIEFDDLSAFAVSLGKFKSDYDSCLSEIVLVQNTKSLVETCVYLSYGRKIVHKALRKIKDIYYLEVIIISDQVYKSFSRKDKKPFFSKTQMHRILLRVDQFTGVETKFEQSQQIELKIHKKLINLREFLDEEDAFIFFMKNIVQNFIEIKYLHKIETYLLSLNTQENFEIFDQKQIKPYQKHNIDIITNNEQLCELKEFKPIVHSSIKHLRQILLKYCQIYELSQSFKIIKKTEHLLHINKKVYIAIEILLSNKVRIVNVFKKRKRQNYHLFIYHQKPSALMFLDTSFHKRLIMMDKDKLIGNLIRRQKGQMYLSDDCSSVSKNVIKYENSYCYVSVSQCQSIICWRFDYYFPLHQALYSTFLDEEIYLECLGQWSQNQQMWKQTIKQVKINLSDCSIKVHRRSVKLFKSIKRLIFDEHSAKGILQLIQLSGQLLFLITNFESGTLSYGKVDNIMYLNNKSIFPSMNLNKERVVMYDNIMNHLYYKILTGKLPSQIISADFFIDGDQN